MNEHAETIVIQPAAIPDGNCFGCRCVIAIANKLIGVACFCMYFHEMVSRWFNKKKL